MSLYTILTQGRLIVLVLRYIQIRKEDRAVDSTWDCPAEAVFEELQNVKHRETLEAGEAAVQSQVTLTSIREQQV